MRYNLNDLDMRLLVSVPYNPHVHNHGNAVRVLNMLRCFKDYGIQVYSILYDLPWNVKDEYDLYTYEYSVKFEFWVISQLIYRLTKVPIYKYLRTIYKPIRNHDNNIRNIINDNHINILQCENIWSLPPFLMDGLNLTIPIITTVHDVHSDRFLEICEYLHSNKKLSGHIYNGIRKLEDKYLNMCERVVCLSIEDYNRYIELGVEKNKLKVIQNGVDTSIIKPLKRDNKIEGDIGVKQHDFILFFSGSMMYQNYKAIDDLINIIMPSISKKIDNLKLLIVGSIGKYVERKKYNGNSQIIPVGYVKDIAKYYALSDVVVIPTMLGTGSKLKTIEAMAAGKPVVCLPRAARGIDVTDGKNIAIVDDYDQLVERIIDFSSNPGDAERMGEEARRKAMEYDWKNTMREYLEIYEELL